MMGQKLSDQVRQEILRLAREENLGALSISRKVRCAKSSVQRVLKEATNGAGELDGLETALADLHTRTIVVVGALAARGGVSGVIRDWPPLRRTTLLQKVAAIEARWAPVAAEARQAAGEAQS